MQPDTEGAKLNNKDFETAAWGFSWDEVINNSNGCPQGTVEFDSESGLSLNIPFGRLLEDSSVVVLPPESELPKKA